MGESKCQLTVLDVAELLNSRYAFISGGKHKDGYPIITFPDNPNRPDIPEQKYRDVITYLCSVPSLQEVDLGFVVVIDRRHDKWSAVKSVLVYISTFFPAMIQLVYILKPSGFFQKHFSDMGYKSIKDEFKFEVIMCNNIEELHRCINRDQLTQDLGGFIAYDHEEWIQQRAAIEKFSANTKRISQQIQCVVQKLMEAELPNEVSSTETAIKDHEMEKAEVEEDLRSSVEHGETLLSCIRVPTVEINKKNNEIVFSASKLVHVTAVERLLVQLEETEKAFTDFWTKHHRKLHQCLQLRKFEDDFKQSQYVIERHLKRLRAVEEETEGNITKVDQQMRDMEDFEENSLVDIERANELQLSGQRLIDDDHYAVDSIRPKCLELQRICEQYKEVVRTRNELLRKKKDLHERLERANKWCTHAVDLLTSQPLDHIQSSGEGVEPAMKDLEDFLASAKDLKLSNPREFRQTFDNVLTPEIKTAVQQILKRIEDVQDMCKKRIATLKKISTTKLTRPGQLSAPAPAQVQTPTPQEQVNAKRKYNGEAKKLKSPGLTKNKIQLIRDGNESASSHDSEPESPPSAMQRSQNSINRLNRLSGSDIDTLHAKRGHVMKELIESERVYVAELESIIQGYARDMDDPGMQHLIPTHLKGKKELLFGNMEEIYLFHYNAFLKDLENCANTPTLVGKCFVERREEFQMYSDYCQNKPRSEALRQEVGDNNEFFKYCQKRLNHRLPLGAYLLKPVQRITKYQLLLREMLKYTQNDIGSAELKEALDTMLSVVKYVNDIMHQIAITGFNGNLSDQGKLLMQGSFSMYTEHKQKKDKIKDIRFKPMQRHIFLYEKLVMFCKKKEDSAEKASYIYKSALKMANIGLTENMKGDKRKFEIWVHGRTEVYIITASSEEVKLAWVNEIKRVLQSQFDALKERRKVSVSSSPAPRLPETNGDSIPRSDSDSAYSSNNNTATPTSPSDMFLPLDGSRAAEYEHFSDDEEDNWSSDEFSEEEGQDEPVVFQYTVLADYQPVDETELAIQEGEVVDLITTGDMGWWYVRSCRTGREGWAPATYLEPASRRSSRSAVSMSSVESGHCNSNGIRHSASRTSINSTGGLNLRDKQTLLDELEEAVV